MIREIASDIFVETDFHGANVAYVRTDEGVILIDTPMLPIEARQWRAEIEEKTGQQIVYIINTDHHRDHALGNYYFDGDIVHHEGTMERLLDEDGSDLCVNWIALMEPESRSLMDHYFVRKPSLTYVEMLAVLIQIVIKIYNGI